MNKRDEIIRAAEHAFLTKGYNTTTMDGLAEAANVSKKTLYAHFPHKQEIFSEVIRALCHSVGTRIVESAPPFGEPATVLAEIARQYLARFADPKIFRVFKLIIAEGESMPELGEAFWQAGPGPATAYVQAYLTELDRQGVLQVADPETAAGDFLIAVIGHDFLAQLIGYAKRPTKRSVEARIERAVDRFLANFRPK